MADAQKVIDRLKYVIGDLIVENSIQRIELEEANGDINADS